ncbi:MAG: CDC27 family protein, partial [Ignavibacteria bacterium]|nr:CDC27 family protein [Ignavibacteria bacterium]
MHSQSRFENCSCNFSFAKWLYLNGDYDRSINLLEKLIDSPMNSSADSIFYLLAKCYEKIGDYEKSNLWFEKLIKSNSKLKAQSLIQTYRNKFLVNDYNFFNKPFYNELDLIQNNQFFRYKVSSKLFNKDTTEIFNDLNKVKDTLISNYLIRKLVELTELKFKSPLLAGLYSSMIPGSGKIYTENYTDGVTSFVLTSLFAFLSYDNFKNYHQFRGWIFGGTSLFFYLGNIYGSILSAKLFNLNKIHEYQRDLYDGILMSDFIGDAIESREASCYSLDICELTSIKSIYEYAQKLIENEN